MKKNQGQITGFASPLLESIRMKIIIKSVTGGDILDYGCGYGKFSEVIGFNTYTGVDVDSDAISYAKGRYSHLKNIAFYTVEEFESKNGQYDFIILSAVIEHFTNPLTILTMLKQRLKNHGKIIITTPTNFGNNILKYGSKIGLFSRNAFEEHNQIFSKVDFFNIAKNLDLKVLKYTMFECGTNQFVVLSFED